MNQLTISQTPEQILYILDMLGIIACAFAGTLLAKHKGLDVSGCILVAMVNAIGGGTIRDVLLDRHPLFWMTDLTYLWIILSVSVLVQVFFYVSHHVESLIKRFDAIGLAAFTLIGLKVGISQGFAYPVAILMGVITAVVGGLIRDIICNEIPLVLRQEIYITAAIIGALLYWLISRFSIESWLVDLITILAIYAVRMLAVRLDWHLPEITLKNNKL